MKFIYILFVAITLTACQKKGRQEQTTASENTTDSNIVSLTKEQMELAGIKLGGLKDTILNEEISANGMIDVPPQNFASVSAPMGGYVKSTQVLPGMEVDKGQLLAVLEHQDYIQLQQDYLQASNRLDLAKTENGRQKELYEGNASSSKKFQTSESDYKSSQALLRSLEEKLRLMGVDFDKLRHGEITSKMYIKSPIHGNIKSVNASIGKYIGPSDVMYEIVDNSHQHLELKVFEKDILKIAEDQKIIFTVPTIGTEQFEASVYLVGRSLDQVSRTITLHGHLAKEDKERLLPGMYVNAIIVANKKKTQVLPEEALVMEDQQFYIFRKIGMNGNDTRFKKLKVTTGLRKNNWVEISGLHEEPDDKDIVIQGAYSINSKMTNVEEE